MNTSPETDFPQHDPYESLRVKEFLYFICTRFFLTMGIQMQTVIVGLQVYMLTGDKFLLGMLGLSEAIPLIICSIFAGHVADIVNRKIIILISTFLLVAGSVVLFLFSLDGSAFLHKAGIMPVYIVIALTGVLRSFLAPSFPALLAQILPRKLFVNAATWNSTVWHIGAVLAPILGGFLSYVGYLYAHGITAVIIFISILFMMMIRSRPVPPQEKNVSLKENLSAGMKFVFNNKIFRGAISLDLFAVLFGGAVAMIAPVAKEIFHVKNVEFATGVLRAAPAIGAILMALVLAYRPINKKAGKYLFISVALFGIFTICFALSSNIYLSWIFLLLTGAFDNVSVVIRHTILQLMSPDSMRGKVSSVNTIFISSSNEIGAAESGIAADLMGLVPSMVFGGIMTLLVVFITARLVPELRKLNLNEYK